MPKFSIIIPIYNVEKYLSKCLDSLVNQTFTDIEIICVNDGSSDNSLQVLNEYASQDNRIKVINQENLGVSTARNVGIDNATGEYLLFVDADDWLDLKTCEILYNSISINSADLLSFNAFFVKNKQEIYGLKKNLNSVLYGEMWSISYKKDFLLKYNIKFPKHIKIAEDHIFKIQALINTNKILILEDYLYYYCADRENSSSKIKSVVDDDIQSFYYLIEQDWFVKCDNIKKQQIIDYWLKLIGGTLLNVRASTINISNLCNYINRMENLQNDSQIGLKNLKVLKIFTLLLKIKIFPIYSKIIRPIGKHCIVLPYRRIKQIFRGKNV